MHALIAIRKRRTESLIEIKTIKNSKKNKNKKSNLKKKE